MCLFSTSLSRQGRFMRSVAPARGLLRQSQNGLPRADPPIFCRRFAPLTPAQARRSFSASACAAKEIVMSAAIMIGILVPMSGAGALDVDPASHPVSLPMTPMAASSPKLGSLWADQIAAARSRVEQNRVIAPEIKLVPAIDTLTASFKIGTDTLFVSAFTGACKDADWLPKGSENSIAYCPLRVAIISGGAMKLLAETPSACVALTFDPSGKTNKLLDDFAARNFAVFDAKTQTITVKAPNTQTHFCAAGDNSPISLAR